MKKGWLSSLWDRVASRGYEAVGVMVTPIQYKGSRGYDHISYIFLENAEGQRKLRFEVSARHVRAKHTNRYHSYCVPWLNGQIGLDEVTPLTSDPYSYEKLGYALQGSSVINSTYKEKPVTITYLFFEHKNGNRRSRKISDQDIHVRSMTDKIKDWERGAIETDDLPWFKRVKPLPLQKEPSPGENLPDNIIQADFRTPQKPKR